MSSRARLALFLIILAAVAWFVLDRVRIVVFVKTSPLMLLAFVVIAAIVIFVILDHLINRTR